MNKIGRNQTCPCGSGRKFKTCCLRKLQAIQHFGKPFIAPPFSLHTLVFLDDEAIKNDVPSYWPICVIGRTARSVTFKATGPEVLDSEQIVRLGFCNKEYRPIVQMRTDRGVYELRGNDVLKPGPHILTAIFDRQRIRLLVNFELRQETTIDGELALTGSEEVSIGHGEGLGIQYCHIHRGCYDGSPIERNCIYPPDDVSEWTRHRGFISKVFDDDNERESLAYCMFSQWWVFRERTTPDLAHRIVAAFGVSDAIGLNATQIGALAASKLNDVTDELERIVTDSTKAEPDLLVFFKNNPGAAFLLEPSVHRQWREQSIQNYGRIDFVFELTDGTFRVIEIESHMQRLFTKADEFAQPFRHATEQVRSWIRGVAKLPAVATRQFGNDESAAYRGLVIIGRSEEITNPSRRERWHAEKAMLESMTWDDIIARGRLIARKLNDPTLDEYEWEDS